MRLRYILFSVLTLLTVVPATAGMISRTGPVITVAVPNITRPFGVESTDLPSGQTIHASSTDYLLGGSLIMKNGLLDRLLFDGGYARATAISSTTYGFDFYYYNRDHLGNNREVVNNSGTVQQVTNYYPFGAPYADPAAVMGASLQPYKYNGKELDLMHGLNTYDYGARQYDPILARWDRIDPLCEKKPWQSPYIYGKNNPLRYIDPDGKDDMDKAVGYLVGVATNIMPIPGARDLYSPTDANDYNAALQTTDNTFMAMGNSMVDAGNGGAAIGTAVAASGGVIVAGSGGTATVAGVTTAVAGVTLAGVGVATSLAGTLVKMNATSNKNGGYNYGKRAGASKNERHGDGGRALSKSDKQISNLQKQIENTTSKKIQRKITTKIRHIKEISFKKNHGEEHSKANKR